MVLISDFVGPPNVHLNTDPIPSVLVMWVVVTGTQETPNRCHVLERSVFFPLEELAIEIPNQFRLLGRGSLSECVRSLFALTCLQKQ